MARNKINDLRDHLFAQLERLEDEELKGDDLREELQRAKGIKNIADTLIDSARVEIEFLKQTGSSDPSTFLQGENYQKKLGE